MSSEDVQQKERRVLIAVCEGCGAEVPMPTTDPRRVYPDSPRGWTGWGKSRYRIASHSERIALWCPKCQVKR